MKHSQKEQEIAELKDKSSHKGIHFENDAVDTLQDVADVRDRIEHTGGSGEGASRSKGRGYCHRYPTPRRPRDAYCN